MSDDDKILFKMSVQKIILDSRFGDGASIRMLNQEMNQPQLVTVAAPTVLTLDQQQQLGGLIVHSVPVSLATSIGVPVTTSGAQSQQQQAQTQSLGGRR
ncbi:hypothetical protein L596_017659 [Steinernema carpocapsae]|uniref:Uncharacterized protein n=1 Tax=Steinernema carpocapsae TaxID=34508 RepID=A0A4V6A1Y5_STECR|nr:hypothetical protein L596_017659 [Steinernema carpocapsae]